MPQPLGPKRMLSPFLKVSFVGIRSLMKPDLAENEEIMMISYPQIGHWSMMIPRYSMGRLETKL